MKLKNKQIIDSVPALNRLAEQKLNAKTAYTIAKNIRELSALLEDVEKIKTQTINKWVEKDKKGEPIKDENQDNSYKLKKDNKLNEEMNELLNVENEVKIETINIKDLEDVKIEPNILLSIDWMIKQE